MKRGALLGLLALAGCAPRMTAPPSFSAANPQVYRALIAPFEADLRVAGVTFSKASVYEYRGTDPNAFQQATNDFYRRYPDFCPAQGGFLSATERPVYLTLAVKGSEVRAFVYDQSERPKLRFAYAEGVSAVSLERAVCPAR